MKEDEERFTRLKLEERLAKELQDSKLMACSHFSRDFKEMLKLEPCPHEQQKDKKQGKRIDPCVIN